MGKDFKTLVREQGEKLRADSLLSTEKGGLAVEQVKGDHVVVGTSGIRDDGIPFVQVAPQPASERPPLVGPAQGFRGPSSIHEGLVREAAEREARHAEARAGIIPHVWFYGTRATCLHFVRTGGDYQKIGQPVWCQAPCPSLSGDVCAGGEMGPADRILIRKCVPRDQAEYDALMLQEGAVEGANTEELVRDEMSRLGSLRETEQRHAREAVVARDLEIMRLRAEDRRKPKFTAVDSPRDMHDKLAAAKAAVGGR